MDREIKEALEQTGFEICNFPPDDDGDCERCGEVNKQLYFRGPTDAGQYYCLDCVIIEYEENLEWGRQLLGIEKGGPADE